MDDVRLWQIGVCFAIGIHCLAFSVAQGVDECSPRCWNPVQPNFAVRGGIYREGVASEEECKALCVNNGKCIGIDWNRTSSTCWFQLTKLNLYTRTNVNHWSIANCTDDCASFCWRAVRVGFHVFGGVNQTDITDENRCKLRCSSTPNCNGIDWDSSCYLLFINNPTESVLVDVHHWDIERSLPVSCISPASPASSATSNTVSPTQDTTNHTVDGQSSTNSLEDRTAGFSVNLIPGIIVLAVFLGLCIIIIIGLSFNTIRIGRRSHVISDIKSDELSGNDNEGLEKDETQQRSEEGIYTDIVQENLIDIPCEPFDDNGIGLIS